MGFLAPIAAPILKAGLGIGSSLLGSKLGSVHPTDQERQVMANDIAAQQLGLGTARQTIPQAQNLIGLGTSGFNAPMNYWSSILSGNRGLATSALAPEIGRIGQGYQTAARTSAALNPRGGPSASFLSELPFQQQRDVSTLMQQARPQAATSLFGAAQGVTGAGSNLLNTGVNTLLGSTQAGRDILTQAQNARQIEQQRGQGIGAGLFDIINKYGFPAIDQILQRNKPNLGSGPGYPNYPADQMGPQVFGSGMGPGGAIS